MRVVHERAGPGVQHGEDPDGPAEIVRVGRERLARLGRRLHQRAQQDALMRTDDRPELGGQREDDMKVGHRQQLGLARRRPRVGTRAVTGRTLAMPARVIDKVLEAAGVALRNMPTHGRGPTGGKIRQGTPMARRHRGAEARRIGRPELADRRGDGHAPDASRPRAL